MFITFGFQATLDITARPRPPQLADQDRAVTSVRASPTPITVPWLSSVPLTRSIFVLVFYDDILTSNALDDICKMCMCFPLFLSFKNLSNAT